MDKKGIAEVKKCFKKEDCRIDRMVSCFVNEEGEVISRFSDSFYALEDKELFKYCELWNIRWIRFNISSLEDICNVGSS